jgi:hypothetical protein
MLENIHYNIIYVDLYMSRLLFLYIRLQMSFIYVYINQRNIKNLINH